MILAALEDTDGVRWNTDEMRTTPEKKQLQLGESTNLTAAWTGQVNLSNTISTFTFSNWGKLYKFLIFSYISFFILYFLAF